MKIILLTNSHEARVAITPLIVGRGINFTPTCDPEDAKALLDMYQFDGILIYGFPSEPLARSLRNTDLKASIIFLGIETPQARAKILMAGADDCMSDPLYASELGARLEAITRRHNLQDNSYLKFGSVVIDIPGRLVTKAGERVALGGKAFDLLVYLARRPTICRHQADCVEYLADNLLDIPDKKVIDVYICRIRRLLGRDFIETIWGRGYKIGSHLCTPQSAAAPASEALTAPHATTSSPPYS